MQIEERGDRGDSLGSGCWKRVKRKGKGAGEYLLSPHAPRSSTYVLFIKHVVLALSQFCEGAKNGKLCGQPGVRVDGKYEVQLEVLSMKCTKWILRRLRAAIINPVRA